MTTFNTKPPLLRLRFEGKAIRDGRILLDDLMLFLDNFQTAIARTIDVLGKGTSTRFGRRPKTTQILSALEVVAMDKGSYTLALDLRREGAILDNLDLGEKAVEYLVSGIEVMDKNVSLPDGYDEGVLIALREAGRVIERGIETIHITATTPSIRKEVRYIKATREHVVSRIKSLEHAWTEVEGRLLMADFKEDTLHCRLHPSTGSPIPCSFDEAMATEVMAHLRMFVQVRGDATIDPITNRIHALHIRDIEPIGQLSGVGIKLMPPAVFWELKTFDQLAEEQGVKPVDDLDKLSGHWPEDADFDSFLKAIREARENW